MTQPSPIEQHYGACELIKACWANDGSADAWRVTLHKLHGAWMAADDALQSDLSLLIDIARARLDMMTPEWRTL